MVAKNKSAQKSAKSKGMVGTGKKVKEVKVLEHKVKSVSTESIHPRTLRKMAEGKI